MTTDAAAAADLSEHQPLFCYRHPDRETWVRCGRCDQPICSKCAMQGPVGLRCKVCGTPSRDALATLRPTQLALAVVVSLAGGAIIGYVGSAMQIFGLVAAFFGGGLIVEAIDRTIGIKRGRRIMTVVLPGVVAGGLVGGVLSVLWSWQQLLSYAGPDAPGLPLDLYLWTILPFSLLAILVATAVAAGRLR